MASLKTRSALNIMSSTDAAIIDPKFRRLIMTYTQDETDFTKVHTDMLVFLNLSEEIIGVKINDH